jgi:hypothetical protein
MAHVRSASVPSLETLGLVAEVVSVEAIEPADRLYGEDHWRAVSTLVWLTEADAAVPLGVMLARHGLDECGRVTFRFATVAEDRAKLAEIVATHGVNVTIGENGAALAIRDADGKIAGEPDDADDDQDWCATAHV